MLLSSIGVPPGQVCHGIRSATGGRRRSQLVTCAIAGAALMIAAAAGCASDNSSGAASPSRPDAAVGATAASASAQGPSAVVLHLPDAIGPLTKASNQTLAQGLIDGAKGSSGTAQIQAVSYEDRSDKSRTVLLYGASGEVPSGSPNEQIDVLLKAKAEAATTVDPGAVGGASKCAKMPGNGVYNCAWVKDKTALIMSFQSYTSNAAQALVPTILAATVT